ncbi:MAG TPA: sigma-70 family RNA polymerase sigma factor [Acidimicrobiales bacterium]|nr:sigma-70 family RNA polymerase sigma factor [Acidimicrobiales bacterium]
MRQEAINGKLADFLATRDPELRHEVVEAHLGLARHLVCRFTNRVQPPEELVQVAALGLLKAVDRFDLQRGVDFAAYAAILITGELKRYRRDTAWAVRPPRRLQELSLDLTEVVSAFGPANGHWPTDAEVARQTGVSEHEVSSALQAARARHVTPLEAPDRDTGGSGDLVDHLGQEDPQMAELEDRSMLAHAMTTLSERQRTVLCLRYVDELTQVDIARRIGVSQMQVSRLLHRSLAHLRAYVDADERDKPQPEVGGEAGFSTLLTSSSPVRIDVTGPLDRSTAGDLEHLVSEASRGGALPLVVDLSQVTHLRSAGLQVLCRMADRAARHAQQLRVIAPPSCAAHPVLTRAGFTHSSE